MCDGLNQLLGDVDVCLIEVGLPDGIPYDGHLSPSDIMVLAGQFPQVDFYLTHVWWAEAQLSTESQLQGLREFDNILFPTDGAKYEL